MSAKIHYKYPRAAESLKPMLVGAPANRLVGERASNNIEEIVRKLQQENEEFLERLGESIRNKNLTDDIGLVPKNDMLY